MADSPASPARVARVAPTRRPTLADHPPVELSAAQRTRAGELAPVLRAVKAGDAWLEEDGRSTETNRKYLGVSDPIGDITDEMRLAEAAGLATVLPFAYGPGGMWELTPAGVKALTELDAKGR